MSAAFLLLSSDVYADSAAAKAVLAQSTTNAFCSAGFNEANPFDKTEMFKKDQFKGECPPGMPYVQCLRESWKAKQN
jgi:hypothetical protein